MYIHPCDVVFEENISMKIEIKTIVCPTDFSASAEHAFHYAIAIAMRHKARIELLHVTLPSAYAEIEGENGEAYENKLRMRLRAIAAIAPTDLEVQTTLITGIPTIEILRHATALPADLIVIGTHGRTGMKHLLIGSVAERIVRTAACPVCTVRHPDHVILPEEGK